MQTYDPNTFISVDSIELSDDTQKLLERSREVYLDNFSGRTWYGRCIFLSWYCSLGDCTFCFRSTQKHKIQHPAGSKRSMGSVLLEALFCKVFHWRIEFLTGGYGMMPFPELLEFAKNVSTVYGEKIWLNIGVISPNHLEELRPYVKGICASMETLHPQIHKEVCPSKPIEPYDKMFSTLTGFKKSIAVIVGLGDTVEDMHYLFDFIRKHDLDRITLYALKPIKGGAFTQGPSVEEYVRWIALLRINFPRLEIIAGTNLRRSEEVGYLMRAGANAITKFPATKQFGTSRAAMVTDLIQDEGRDFVSNLIDCSSVDWQNEIDSLEIEEQYKEQMRKSLPLYLNGFNSGSESDS
ncbi:radical SAM protein [Candidatus Woesearchaeota archaeon CG10_big_fil_rev_8_21_14_0_10_45_16]|nr:MAG: radical SAM protein [Candidatus Woesearchaeota archaeon CG10_big_fil_rev_8_21_14_0_10_45_16]